MVSSHIGTQLENVISVILVISVIRMFLLLFESIIVAAGHSCVSKSQEGDSYFCYLRLLFLLFENVIGDLYDSIIVAAGHGGLSMS